MADLYKKVEEYLEARAEVEPGLKELIPHFKRTAYWVMVLQPKANDALKIAALAHDFDRTENLEEHRRNLAENKKGMNDENFNRKHEERAAEKIYDFLISSGADMKFSGEVRSLVSRHEEGGTVEQNILKDADSISFLENNVEHFISMLPRLGKEKVLDKFNYMYERITTKEAKEIAKPMYEEALRILEYTMKENRISILINKSVSEVFEFTINPDNTPFWIDSIIHEETDEWPIKVGSKYRNHGVDEVWDEYFVSKLEKNKLFELTSSDKNYHVRYSYNELEPGESEMEYFEWVAEGELEKPFNQTTLMKLKEVIENE